MPSSASPPHLDFPDFRAAAVRAAEATARAEAQAALPPEIPRTYDEGVADGRTEGHEAGFAEGYAAGEQAGRHAAGAEELAQAGTVLAGLHAAAEAWRLEAERTQTGLATLVRVLAVELAEHVLAEPILHTPEHVQGRIAALLHEVGPLDTAALTLHPDDLALLEPLGTWREWRRAHPQLHVTTDPAVARGGCRLSTALHHLELHWMDRLDRLRDALARAH
jgi:flagellar assembly protein FliH